MYIPDWFELYEYLPEDFYKKYFPIYGNKLWQMFDERLLITEDNLRRRYGTMIKNDWLWRKGDKNANHLRGWRPTDCPIGALASQHKYGRAGDSKPVHVTAEHIRQDILKDPWHEDFKFITCIEMDVPWLHIDCRNHDKSISGILKVYRG